MSELKNKQASDSASADAGLSAPSGIAEPILQYMGLEINRNSLYRKDELVAILDKYGALDSTLDEVRDITSVAKDRKAPSGGKSRTREADDAAIFA